MELNIDFDLVRSQKLLLIPQLKQALEILGMNSQELFAYVEEQMETNPVLEIVMEERPLNTDDLDEADDDSVVDTAITVSLKEYLQFQLDSLELDRVQKRIGEYLIDNTDENGYLKIQISEVSAFFNVPSARVLEVMGIIHDFDPPGICARNLKECLKIQLSQMENVNNDAVLIVEKYLDLLAENNIKAIASATGINVSNVAEAVKLIRTLEPRPGREFYKEEDIRPVAADVTVRNIGLESYVVLNEEAFPDVKILEDYKTYKIEDISGHGELFLKDKIRNAIWLIKCLEQRKNIILKIAEYILNEQKDFFTKGTSFLKKINKKQLEYDLDIHESVLMEAFKGKHLDCRWGIFDFKYFFY